MKQGTFAVAYGTYSTDYHVHGYAGRIYHDGVLKHSISGVDKQMPMKTGSIELTTLHAVRKLLDIAQDKDIHNLVIYLPRKNTCDMVRQNLAVTISDIQVCTADKTVCEEMQEARLCARRECRMGDCCFRSYMRLESRKERLSRELENLPQYDTYGKVNMRMKALEDCVAYAMLDLSCNPDKNHIVICSEELCVAVNAVPYSKEAQWITVVLLIMLLIASILDILKKEIPVWLSLATLVFRGGYLLIAGREFVILESILSGVFLFLFYYLFAKFGSLGGADCLVILSAGFFLGLYGIYAALFSAILSIPHILLAKKRPKRERDYPYIPYILGGVLLALSLMFIRGIEVTFFM